MKNRLMHNLGLKILSIVFAAILWLTIMNIADPVESRSFSGIAVQILNDEVITSRGYQYSIESGEVTEIKVKGKRSEVDKLDASDFKVYADFNTLNSMYMASIEVQCTAEHAEGISISLKNDTMAVKLEDQDTQPYSVHVTLNGEVKSGYYCKAAKVSSTLIQVTGSLSQISAISELAVDIDIDGKMNSFSTVCDLVAYDADGNAIDSKKITFSQDTVEVDVEICPTRLVAVEVTAEGSPDERFYVDSIEFAPSSVLLAADEDALIRLSKLRIPFDVTGISSNLESQIDISEYLAGLYGDEYICVDKNDTLGVVATVKELSTTNVDLNAGDIEMRNLGESFEATIYSVIGNGIKISGREEELTDIAASDLGLYVDLSGCVAGTYSRQIKSDYQGNLKLDFGSVMVRIAEKTSED